MKIVIPAAGQGIRLRPHTHTLPKVMLPVAGRPIIGHILADVARLDPEEVRHAEGDQRLIECTRCAHRRLLRAHDDHIWPPHSDGDVILNGAISPHVILSEASLRA